MITPENTIWKNCTNATSEAIPLHVQTIWGNSGEKSNKCSQCNYASSWAGNLRMHLKTHNAEKSNTFENPHWRKAKQLQPMWLCILTWRRFKDTFEKTQWRQVSQVPRMWLCIPSGRRFKDTHENTQWRYVKQMQPMWLYILSGIQLEESFKNTQQTKVQQVQPVWLCIPSGRRFEKSFQNSQWIQAKEMQSMCTSMYPLRQAIWRHIWKYTEKKVKEMKPLKVSVPPLKLWFNIMWKNMSVAQFCTVVCCRINLHFTFTY